MHSLAEKNIEERDDDARARKTPDNLSKIEPEKRTETPNLFFSGPSVDDVERDEKDNMIEMESERETKSSNHFFSGPSKKADERNEEGDTELFRSLALTRSKIAKRNIVSHEALAGKLSADALFCVLQPLVFDFWDKPLLLPFKTDSTCCLAMMNPAIELKNMLLSNAIAAFKDELIKISIQFPKSLITVGHIVGTANPSDVLTKLYRDPIKAINSQLYRYGPPLYGSKRELYKDVVFTC